MSKHLNMNKFINKIKDLWIRSFPDIIIGWLLKLIEMENDQIYVLTIVNLENRRWGKGPISFLTKFQAKSKDL